MFPIFSFSSLVSCSEVLTDRVFFDEYFTEVVINRSYGGFSLSEEAKALLPKDFDYYQERSNKRLVDVVKKLGNKANGNHADLKVKVIPSCYSYIIDEYDGCESIVLRPKKSAIKAILNDRIRTKEEIQKELLEYLDAAGLFDYGDED